MKADRAALRRAVLNLLQNAIKYGGEGPRIALRVSGPRGRGRPEVRIEVEDHGLGIAPGERDRIFEPFVRGEEATGRSDPGQRPRPEPGEAHRGGATPAAISVTSAPGRGSTFVIDLPVSGRDDGRARPIEEEAHGTAHPAG